jgi:hypothetical protein
MASATGRCTYVKGIGYFLKKKTRKVIEVLKNREGSTKYISEDIL